MPSKHSSSSPNVHALLHEKLDALLAECNIVMDTAKHGRTVHDLDDFFCTKGHDFLQEVYQQKLQERVQQVEETTEGKQCPHCKKKATYQTKREKTITATHGQFVITRTYRHCSHCKQYSHPVDVTLGMETGYTERLERLVTRCCGDWSYRHAADTLKELCGVQLSHVTVSKIFDRTADKLAAKMENNADLRQAFQQAKGETEFYADGVFVHIRDEFGIARWMEMKVGVYAKRLRGMFALPAERYTRNLPEPTVVAAFASIVDKEGFQELCQSMRRCFGVGGVSTALGDGAKWIWNVHQFVHGKTEECLDIYHGAEHISACAKVLFGEGESSSEWFERMRMVLLSEGLGGLERELSVVLSGELKESHRASVVSLLDYFRGNGERLNYCERLSQGRAIGSGLIEGACKNLVGRRLKQTGACWRLERANKMALVCGVLYSDQWKICWKNAH